MKEKKLVWLALAASLLTMTTAARADTLLEKIAMTVLADKFGIDTREVIVLRERTQAPVYDLAPIYQGAYYFKRSPQTVWQLRNEGLGWGQIAHRCGMQPGEFNKLRNQGVFDRDQFWTTSYRERFGVPTERIQVMRKAGGSLEDVLGAVIIGKLTRTDPRQVYNQYQTQGSWVNVSNRNNVRFEDWRRVSTPVRTRYSIPTRIIRTNPKPAPGVRDHGKGIGKGKSKGLTWDNPARVKTHDDGAKVRGHGKDKSKDKSGPGKSKGKGNGKGNGKGKGN